MESTGSGPTRRQMRLQRIAEDLTEAGFEFVDEQVKELVVDEVRHALHPPVHERRIPSMGSIVHPQADPPHWREITNLEIIERPVADQPLEWARRFADGLSSWLVRRPGDGSSWVVFDRPSGSERDLGVLADAFDATIVQRHPAGMVRVVGGAGVWRWERFDWHHERRVGAWFDGLDDGLELGDPHVLRAMLEFAVHDLGALGIGATLIYRPIDDDLGPRVEARLPLPPALDITRPLSLAPLRHALAQVDGASIFDAGGCLRQIGVRLVSSPAAEGAVKGMRGMRHTSALRYSFDDPRAAVIVVSEDGPVSLLRAGEVLGSSLRPRSATGP